MISSFHARPPFFTAPRVPSPFCVSFLLFFGGKVGCALFFFPPLCAWCVCVCVAIRDGVQREEEEEESDLRVLRRRPNERTDQGEEEEDSVGIRGEEGGKEGTQFTSRKSLF